ncbi:hypothetical protein CUS_6180 [Ruminococcus albus 8]|uniref:Uncharacterized protein n=1 Tax=Ruminococcus albus 8 TaxID=246199 RepID=E9S7G8_RUMAL|nr:hypothetical protein CUS_6180 [Ruminococcus albus 8]
MVIVDVDICFSFHYGIIPYIIITQSKKNSSDFSKLFLRT